MTHRVIVPLDGMKEAEALEFADQLRNLVWGFKVNDLLVDCGLSIISKLKEYGSVFADPKLHDIPNTVHNSVSKLCNAGADLVTVHCSGGRPMLEAANEAAHGATLLGVTVLTSLGDEHCREVFECDAASAVKRFATLAASAGLPGIVCSPKELELLAQVPETESLLKVTPGIRPAWHAPADDQSRIMTPLNAVKSGADLLVIGRPITQADDPVDAVKKINAELSPAPAAGA